MDSETIQNKNKMSCFELLSSTVGELEKQVFTSMTAGALHVQ